jgi:putative flippase GtrA
VNLMRGLYDRWRHLVHEIAKFGVVGAVAYLVDVGIFNLLGAKGVGPLSAKTISTIVAATVAYFGNRHWSFTHRARTGLRREYTIFIVLSAIGLGIALACLGFGYYVLGQQSHLAKNFWGNVVGTGLGTIFRFWAYKKFVFLAPDHPKALSIPDPAAKAAAEEAAEEMAAAAARTRT